MTQKVSYEKELAFQADRRKATTEFIKITSDLWYDKSIEIVIFKNQVIDKNVSDIIQLHEYAGEFVQKPISIFDSVEILRAINDIKLPPSKLDIGKLTYEYHSDDNNFSNVKAFVIDKLKGAEETNSITPKDVVLYGFGRIGRLLARELMSKTGKGNQLRLRAIVLRGDSSIETLEKRASLLRTDSVHGNFMGTVGVDTRNNALIINGTTVHIINASDPEEI
ncbi:MAG: glyceraldehyde 3-phosphate dehydrogenase NAD-binding domain-containing protein, partial [Maribacter sp.]